MENINISADDLKTLHEKMNLTHIIMSVEDYLIMVSPERKTEMISLWGSLPPAIEMKNGEIFPVWSEEQRP
jgi:hypothetical protein